MNEYVIVYDAGGMFRETYVDAPNKEIAIRDFRCEVGDYPIKSCELSND